MMLWANMLGNDVGCRTCTWGFCSNQLAGRLARVAGHFFGEPQAFFKLQSDPLEEVPLQEPAVDERMLFGEPEEEMVDAETEMAAEMSRAAAVHLLLYVPVQYASYYLSITVYIIHVQDLNVSLPCGHSFNINHR